MPMLERPPPKRKQAMSEICPEAKRSCCMFVMKQEFNNLLSKKREFLSRQRTSSLLINPLKTAENALIPEFSNFYRRLSNAPMAPEEHTAQLSLIEQVIQESIIIEWPRCVEGLASSSESVEIDMAPLIHRARSVIKCRTSHPTMKIKVCAISQDIDGPLLPQPKTVEAFFRASLVKLSHDGSEPRQVAGRMILTQREGTPATKTSDQNGATVSDGKLIASQAAPDTHAYVLLERMGERNARTTPLKFDNNVLCATFPEMAMALNSMVDRRQLATRYAVQVEVAVNVDNKLIVNHVLLSHPFLIAITNDQTEPLLYSIFWSRMLTNEHTETSEMFRDCSTIPWATLQEGVKQYVKGQIVQARSLRYHELCHLQSMMLLPRLVRCKTNEECESLELELYGDSKCADGSEKRIQIRDRLLAELVLPTTPIERREFMMDKCISILDMTTELQHTVWSWLFKATEMLQDVGHKLCPSPFLGDKKGTKTKKQMAACEEYQTMLSLFNKGILTLASVHTARQIFSDSAVASENDAMLLRLCDENSGFFSFVFGFEEESTNVLRIGSLSAEQVKDFKQGLPEVLMDERLPSKYSSLVKIDVDEQESTKLNISLARKRLIFHTYETLRMDNSVHVHDDETVRVNPLTGEMVARIPHPPTNFLTASESLTGGESAFGNLPAFLSLLHQQVAVPVTSFTGGLRGGFDIRTLLRSITIPEATEESESEGEEESEVMAPQSGQSYTNENMPASGK
ncbi:unnamed protein product [Cylicocyclus nassatus]|uniref:Uncharacterized protein n=1 Tax=Cylicocyclus nassatus TaxID=53992 RepID=A0AA36GWV7_CYLNA|nr:unnamed protein product [Cylicocyclus nassatus]